MQVERVQQGAAPKKGAAAKKSGAFDALLDAPAAEETHEVPTAEAAVEAAPVAGLMTFDTARDAVLADRTARRHGRAMLQALGALQATLLGGGPADAGETLADLAAQMPEADDPVLRLILREIGVRAAVELARHRAQANISTG